MTQKEFLNPPTLPAWGQSFSQVVVIRSDSSRTVYVAGQVSVDAGNNLIGAGSLEVQAERAFQNLVAALAAAGVTPDDVVKLGIYVKHYHPDLAPIIRGAMRKHFTGPHLPVSTWLGVESPALDGLLIEVDAVAIAG